MSLWFSRKLTSSWVRSGRWLRRRQLVAQRLAVVSFGLSLASGLLSTNVGRAASRFVSTSILRPLDLLCDSNGVTALYVFVRKRLVGPSRHFSILLLLVARFWPRDGTILCSRGGHAFSHSWSRRGAAPSAAQARLAVVRIALVTLCARLLPTVRRFCLVGPNVQ